MKILINRFTLRHNDMDYGTGDILEIEDAIGGKLVASSNGAISRVADREVKAARSPKEPDIDKPKDPDEPEGTGGAPMTLPDANPAQAMNKGKGK